MKSKSWSRQLLIFLGCAVSFYIITMPFRHFFALNAVTEVRPASALPPVFGMLFGITGALGCAVGNLVADLQSGYGIFLSVIGFLPQFLYGLIPWLLWKYLNLRGDEPTELPELDTTLHVVKYLIITLINCAGMALTLGLIMQSQGLSKLFSMATLTLFLNNVVFSVILGIPMLLLASFRRNGQISLNGRVILACLSLGILVSVIVGGGIYLEAIKTGDAPMLIWNRVYFYVTLVLTIFFLVDLLFLWYMEHRVTVPLERLSSAAREYAVSDVNGELDHDAFAEKCRSYCSLTTEVGDLSRSFVNMVGDLDNYMDNLKKVTAEKERIGAELSVATQIQASMLPCIFPAFPSHKDIDIYAIMQPAKEVGGDFYDFFFVDSTHLAVVIADVSGKGVPAALFMVISKTMIKNYAQMGNSPAQVFTLANQALCENNDANLFVTAWLGILDVTDGTLTYTNAGHNPPLIRQGNGTFEYLQCRHSFVLAGIDTVVYHEEQTKLDPGSMLFLYTDGVTEDTDTQNELYGDDRLQNWLNAHSSPILEDDLKGLMDDLQKFAKGADQFDDITMVMLHYQPDQKETDSGEAPSLPS